MFGWSTQAAGGHRIDAFVDEVSNRRYDAASQVLAELVRSRQMTESSASRCRDLLRQAARLVDDQERLIEVMAGLALDEEQTRSEIRSLAVTAVAESPAPADGSDAGAEPYLRIWLLGSCRFGYEGERLDGGNGDQAAAVLRYLAAQPPCGVHKDQLAAMFWPESDERSARRSLHQVVYNIRRRMQTIGAEGQLEFSNDRYRLGAVDRRRDVDELDQAMAAARIARDEGDTERLVAACEQVNALYEGDFLADHPYDEWAESPRRHYRMLFREAIGVLIRHWTDNDRLCRTVELAERLLGFDPADEDAARHLMEAQARLGHPQLASAALADLTASLGELGLSPSAETTALARRILPAEPVMSVP